MRDGVCACRQHVHVPLAKHEALAMYTEARAAQQWHKRVLPAHPAVRGADGAQAAGVRLLTRSGGVGRTRGARAAVRTALHLAGVGRRRAAELRAIRRWLGAEYDPPHQGGSEAVTY